MIIVYGHRAFGRVDEYGGEYVQTSFAHVYFMPLVPTESMWVTREGQDGSKLGLKIPLDGKSVLAAYLRSWGLVFGLAPVLIAPGIVTALVALALCALSAYAWTWRELRGVLARKRSDFNLLAYGTRCEPAKMPSELRVGVIAALEERHAKLPGQRPAEDVARFGTTDLDEAVIAYGRLRLAAVSHNDPRAEAAAEQIVMGSHEALPAGDGPYRELRRSDHPSSDAQLAQAVAQHAEHVAAQEAARARASGRQTGVGFWSLPGTKAIVVGGLALFAAGMLLADGQALFHRDQLTPSQIAAEQPFAIAGLIAAAAALGLGGFWLVRFLRAPRPHREITRADDATSLQAQVAAVAAQQSARSATPGFFSLPGMKLIVIAGLALISAALVATNSEALFDPDEVTYTQLDTAPPYFKYVAVTCDSTELFGHTIADPWAGKPRTGLPAENVFLCHLGDHKLVVTTAPSVATLDRRVEGRIRKTVEWRGGWPADLDEASTLQLYLNAKGHENDRNFAIAGLVFAAAALGLGAFWLVRFLLARRRS